MADAAIRHVRRIGDVIGIITVRYELTIREVVRVVDAVHDSEELHITRLFVVIRGCRIVGAMANHAGFRTHRRGVVPAAIGGAKPPDLAARTVAADTGFAASQARERDRRRVVTDRGNLELVEYRLAQRPGNDRSCRRIRPRRLQS